MSNARILTTTAALLLVPGALTLPGALAQNSPLPDAPASPLVLALQAAQQSPAAGPPAAAPAPGADQTLTREQAEQMALQNNPRVTVSHLLALAQRQVVRETRSAELPQLNGAITAQTAEEASRISSGSLTASRLFEHAGAGVNFSQLLTDFGRTHNLVASQKLQQKAQDANALATREDIVLLADQAFYNTLQAQALLRVAQQTVRTRQETENQVSQLTKNNLRSTLDLSFADVNLSQAKLLLLDAQSNAESSMAALDAVLGLDRDLNYRLVDVSSALQPPPPDANSLIQQALAQRPDLQSLTYNQQSAHKFAIAQKDQLLPSISALGTTGTVPVRPDQYFTENWWGAIGVNLSVPIFDGFHYSAQAKEAALRARAADENTRDLRNSIVRDVRTAWLAANTAYQRVSVTAQLLDQANLGLKLAQTRYDLGLSSIVELSQAQLQQTDAQIGNTNAQYQYRLALAALGFQTGVIR